MTNLELELDGEIKNFKIPNIWDEITVKQYQEISKLDETVKTNIDRLIGILSIISNIDESLFYKIPVSKIDKIAELLDFTKKEINKEAKDFIEIDGEKYYTKKNMDDLTFGEVVSIEVIQKEENMNSTIAKILCIFLRKKLENGKLETFDKSFMEREKMFEQISIVDVHQLFIFFSNINNQ